MATPFATATPQGKVMVSVPFAPVPQHVRSSGGDRVEPISAAPCVMISSPGVTVTQAPCSSRSFNRSESRPWKGELAELEERLRRGRTRGRACPPRAADRTYPCRPRTAPLADGAHGRLAPVGAEQTHLPERLAAPHRPQHRGRRPRDPRPRSARCRGARRRRRLGRSPCRKTGSPGFRIRDGSGRRGRTARPQAGRRTQARRSAPRLPRATTSRA